MFIIGEAVIEEELAHERFECDLERCKGACCTLPGGRGAPLEDSEIEELERAFPTVKNYLSPRHLDVIDREGFYEGVPGHYTTTCVENRECVFVYYEGDVARCALERAYVNGETSWRKPVSCHLFPIRADNGSSMRLRYEKIAECSAGRKLGSTNGVSLYEFLGDPLIRKFGNEWYNWFREECKHRNGEGADS